MADNTVINEAKKWIDGLSDGTGAHGSWRLETIGKRYRYQSGDDGKRHRIPVRIRRFAKGIPWSLVFEALKYLESQSPYSGFLFNGVRVDAKYRPTSTVWRRDDQENIDGNAQGSYTLVQDLVEDGFDDVLGTATSSSCSEEVVTQWHWDSAQVEDLPAGGQGCTYAIQSVRRNEDGTIDYALVRRIALTSHIPEHVRVSDEYETVYAQLWDNVYGTPDLFTDHDGNVLSIPSGEALKSTRFRPDILTRRVIRNDDCTFRVEVERKSPKEVPSSEVTSQRTVFTEEQTEEGRAQFSALAKAPVPVAGLIKTHKSKKREDGLYDNTVSARQELNVDNAVSETRVSLHGVTRTVSHRGRQQESPPPVSSAIGRSVRNEKTDGGLWNVVNTYQEPHHHVSDLRSECSKTVFVHSDRQTELMVKNPGGSHVKDASRGVTYQRKVERDEFGGFEVTTSTNSELSVKSAAVEQRTVAKGTVTKTVDRGQPSTGSLSLSTPHVASEMTDGGLYSVTKTTVVARSGPDRVMSERDVFSFTSEKTDIRVSDTVDATLPSETAGRVVRRVSEADDTGFVTTTTREMQERHVDRAVVDTRTTNRAVVTRIGSRNATVSKKASDVPGTSVKSEVTPGGRYNVETVEVKPREGSVERELYEEDAFKTVHEISKVAKRASLQRKYPGAGVTIRQTTSVDENGVSVLSTQTTTEKAGTVSMSHHIGNYVDETVNVSVVSSKPDINTKPVPGTSRTVTWEQTDGGMYKVTEKVSTVKPFSWSLPATDTGYSYARTTYFRNCPEAEAVKVINSLTTAYTAELSRWISVGRGPHSNGIDIQVDFDMDHGTLNGLVKLSASWLPEQAGIDGALDKEFVSFTYTTTSLVSSYIDKAKGYYCYYLHKRWKHIEGRGANKFKGYLNDNKYDASFTFNPRTAVWSIDLCTGITVNTSET